MQSLTRRALATLALVAAAGVHLTAVAQDAAASPASAAATAAPRLAGPPADFVAPAEPGADETNAQRAKSQPGNNAPFWRAVRDSGVQQGITNLPGAEMGTLIQGTVQYPGSRVTSAGEAWRQVRNQWILPYGGALLVIVFVALGLFYAKKGALGGHLPNTGRMIERFTYVERAAHWCNAIAFCVLAISGLVIAFGKFILLPMFGGTLFGWLAFALKNAHNFAGPLFAVSLVVVFVTFVRDNLPAARDIEWLKHAGGMFGDVEVPSGRFNAGEKLVFWGGVFVLGLVVVVSGLVMDMLVPGLAYLRSDMQVAHMVHAVAAVLMMALFLGHIYMGTIGTKDTYSGMRTGFVDEAWAREHHALWADDVLSGRTPARRTPPTEGAGPTVLPT